MNTKINPFKFAVAYYLDSAGTSIKYHGKPQCDYNGKSGKKRMSDMHGKYVDGALLRHAENALVLNVDDYHNIHVQ